MFRFSAIQNYEKRYSTDGGFEITAFLAAIGDFIGIFSLSLLVGAFIGCLTALISFLYIEKVNLDQIVPKWSISTPCCGST